MGQISNSTDFSVFQITFYKKSELVINIQVAAIGESSSASVKHTDLCLQMWIWLQLAAASIVRLSLGSIHLFLKNLF